ncbi:MAG: nicotinate phosphoribosyltransferase [Polyangiaceae bacterium]|nr:nicotinate phosphoribosyltransferase [Polyangiaceae bacterium]
MGSESRGQWPEPAADGLLTELYELTMASSYLQLGMHDTAVFSLFVRKLPPRRRMLVVCGIDAAIRRLESFRYDLDSIDYLGATGRFRPEDLRAFAEVRFTGDVWAGKEGELVFENEPILEVHAPIIEAQLVETIVLNAIHYATAVASKAARCVAAAEGRAVVEFGLRRAPEPEGGVTAARAAYLAGFDSTSNVLAGCVYGIPISGTVAHSFIEAFETERAAFRAVLRTADGPSTLLVDTYDTMHGVSNAIVVMRELRANGHLVRAGAPIDGFGVGTRLVMASDAPVLDMAYKIVEYAGQPRLKMSGGKATTAFAKQVWRRARDGQYAEDILCRRDEPAPDPACHPLLEHVVEHGRRRRPEIPLNELRAGHAREVARFGRYRSLRGDGTYPVRFSSRLMETERQAVADVGYREWQSMARAAPRPRARVSWQGRYEPWFGKSFVIERTPVET